MVRNMTLQKKKHLHESWSKNLFLAVFFAIRSFKKKYPFFFPTGRLRKQKKNDKRNQRNGNHMLNSPKKKLRGTRTFNGKVEDFFRRQLVVLLS